MKKDDGIAAAGFFVGFGLVGLILWLPAYFGIPAQLIQGVQWSLAVVVLIVAVLLLYRHFADGRISPLPPGGGSGGWGKSRRPPRSRRRR